MAAYLALKLFDIIAQGQVGLLFAGNMQYVFIRIIFRNYHSARNYLLVRMPKLVMVY